MQKLQCRPNKALAQYTWSSEVCTAYEPSLCGPYVPVVIVTGDSKVPLAVQHLLMALSAMNQWAELPCVYHLCGICGIQGFKLKKCLSSGPRLAVTHLGV